MVGPFNSPVAGFLFARTALLARKPSLTLPVGAKAWLYSDVGVSGELAQALSNSTAANINPFGVIEVSLMCSAWVLPSSITLHCFHGV